MRALAEFVMRGRAQAIGVAVLAVSSELMAIVGFAVVGLVTLRRGAKDGLVVMLWAQLPALVLAVKFGDISSTVALAGIAASALVLRSMRSWPLALLIAVAAALSATLLFSSIASNYVEQWIAGAEQVLAEIGRNQPDAAPFQWSSPLVAGVLGWGVGGCVVISLLLARWWQALLFNSGGFRSEFHQLRLPPAMVLSLIAIAVAIGSINRDYMAWAMIFTMPLGLAGLALAHATVAYKNMGKGVLVAVYAALILVPWAKAVLLLLASVDSFVNFRGRLGVRPQ